MKILNYGSMNLDHVYQVPHFVQPGETICAAGMNLFCGGKGLNQSIAVAKAGGKVCHAGIVGEDGGGMVEELRRAGVDVSLIRRAPGPSSHTVIQVDPSGQNSIIVYSGENMRLSPRDLDQILSGFEAGDLILLQNELFGSPLMMEKAAAKGLTVILNPSPADEGLRAFPLDKVDWYRDIPMDGDLQMADYVLRRLGERGSANNLPLAEILRMIYKGNLAVTSELNGPVNISFAQRDGLSEVSKDFYNMLKEASGSDCILQDKEFSQWASSHKSRVYQWSENSRTDGLAKFRAKRYLRNEKFSTEGQAEARKLMGLRKFLNDFTFLNQRESIEANLWKEYMVYAALFGIADKVAKQLKDIDPKFFEKTFSYDYRTFSSVLSSSQSISRALGNAIVSATRPVYYSSGGSSSSSSYSGRSRSGGGGYTSRSGGRGYSGGGRGGGGR